MYIKRYKPKTWSPEVHWQFPQDFRQAIRELLLAHRRLEANQERCQDGELGLGRLPLSLVLKIVEKLNIQEAINDRELEQMLCPFVVNTVQSAECMRTDLRRRSLLSSIGGLIYHDFYMSREQFEK